MLCRLEPMVSPIKSVASESFTPPPGSRYLPTPWWIPPSSTLRSIMVPVAGLMDRVRPRSGIDGQQGALVCVLTCCHMTVTAQQRRAAQRSMCGGHHLGADRYSHVFFCELQKSQINVTKSSLKSFLSLWLCRLGPDLSSNVHLWEVRGTTRSL